MSRLKILILVLIIGALAVVFVQNKEPVALKLLCNQLGSQYCLLQTAKLPLAIWISLFVIGGIVTNLISQVFSRYSYTSISNKRYSESQKSNENKRWAGQNSELNNYSNMSVTQTKDNSTKAKIKTANNYEVSQKPQEVERSGSNYSYKYRSVDKTPDSQTKTKNTSIDLDKDVNLISEPEDEDWI